MHVIHVNMIPCFTFSQVNVSSVVLDHLEWSEYFCRNVAVMLFISFLTHITLPGMDGILLCFPITQDPSCVTLVLCQVRLIFLSNKHISNLFSSSVYSVLCSLQYALSLKWCSTCHSFPWVIFLEYLRACSYSRSLAESNRWCVE